METEPLTYGYTEAARLLGVSDRFLRRCVSAGQIRHSKLGTNVRFTRGQLEEYLRFCEQPVVRRAARRL